MSFEASASAAAAPAAAAATSSATAPQHRPNVLITGTPGTGKTTLSEMVADATGMTHINVGEWVRTKGLHDGRDEDWDSFVLDEDKVVDEMEETMAGAGAGGCVVDFHTCDFFPERWFQLVIVLRADNTVLYERLEKRGYSAKKITENVQAEIMQVVWDEASDSYDAAITKQVQSDTVAQMEANVASIVAWYKAECARLGFE